MIYRKPRSDEWSQYELLTQHPLQSKAWGDFRESTGLETVQLVGFNDRKMQSQIQLTLHPIPGFNTKIGYCPKGIFPDVIQLNTLRELGEQLGLLFIKLEPDTSSPPFGQDEIGGFQKFLEENGCQLGRAMFTPYSFIIDLRQTEEELLAKMKPKTRYNIRIAQKHEVQVIEDSTDEGFQDYLSLLKVTTKRQKFYAHDEEYQLKMWKMMQGAGIAKVLKATYQGKVIACYILFLYKNKLYYPYGASSRENNEVMGSNLLMWEAMKYGKANGCEWFDMWGALGPDPDPKDPWYGFHKFKEGYGGDLVSFVGSYDLVIDPQRYKLFRLVDSWRWRWLRLRASLPF
jgi:lipid II:glycine glycyltransferase (peptidoglycan interpeptide bridge formation enzyme)